MNDYDLTLEKIDAISEILTNCDEETLEEINKGQEKPIQENKIGVYVKINSEGFVTDVGSDIFISNLDGWVKIDEGFGDKYAHAQSHYFDTPLVDDEGNYLVKL